MFKPQQIKTSKKLLIKINKIEFSLKLAISLVGYFMDRDPTPYISALSAYGRNMSTNVDHEGPRETARKYKEYFHIGTRVAMGLPIDPLPFTKITRKGLPFRLKPVEPFLFGDKWDKRIGLTILRIYTLIRLEPSKDVSAVVTPGKDISPSFMDKWEKYVRDNVKDLPIPVYPSPAVFTFGSRKGPNGPAVLTAHLDAIALKSSPLFSTFMNVARAVEFPLLSSLSTCLTHKGPITGLNVGKVSFIPEKGGKTRLIAIVDFWSQQLLKGFHISLIDYIARQFRMTDSTFNQDHGFKRAMAESKGRKVYSFDLKSATDRFPYVLQQTVLKCLWGDVGLQVGKLLVDREFRVKGVDNPVKWVRGQPLGSYSSWPLFTLSHHLFVGLSAHLVGIRDFKQYQLLGDDIIIWNEDVATSYKSLMDEIDVSISIEKSVVSTDLNNTVGEFAKRFFQNGIEISPLSPTMLLTVSESLYEVPNLVRELVMKWEAVETPSELLALEAFPKKGRQILSILFGCTHLLKGVYPLNWCGFSSEIGTLLKGLTRYLDKMQANTLFQGLRPGKSPIKVDQLEKELKKVGLVVSDSLLQPGYDGDDPHPIVLALGPMKDQVRQQWAPGEFQLETVSIFASMATRAVVDPGLPKAIREQRHLRTEDLSLYFYNDKTKVLPKLALEYYYKIAKGTEKLPTIEWLISNFR